MNPRALSLLALVLSLAAVGAWVWLGREGTPPTPEAASSAAVVGSSQGGVAPVATPPAGGVLSAEPSAPGEPVRVTSSVAPGMPLVRTAPATPRPLGAAPPAAAATASRPDPQAEGKADLEGVQFMFRDFRTRMGENPVGSNAEIMKAVMGDNPVRARLGPPEGQSLNENGELVDRWGVPYFFHQLSKDSMEIRSAGPDGVMWNSDDLVGK